MSNEYREQQIIKHALQYYIQRPNASELDKKREQKVLDKVTDEVKRMQKQWDIPVKECGSDEWTNYIPRWKWLTQLIEWW